MRAVTNRFVKARGLKPEAVSTRAGCPRTQSSGLTTLLTHDQGTYSLETVMTVALFIIPLALAAFIGQDILGDYYRWTVDFLVWPR